MITTLAALAAVCLLSLAFILVIPYFGYLLTALAAAGYVGLLFFLGADGLRRGYGFWLLFGRFMLFMYGYKLFDILVQDQYIVITRKYYVQFYPETKECKSWDDRSFNTKNQMIRLIAFPFVCALMAWITLGHRAVKR